MLIKEIVQYLEQLYPPQLAIESDFNRIGFIIGDLNFEVSNVLMALDLTLEVAQEAVLKNANLIITHHPFFFQPLDKIMFSSEKGQILNLLFTHRLSLFVMHTNLDVGNNGVNDTLARLIGLIDFKVINNEVGKGNFLRYGEIRPLTLASLALKLKNDLDLTGVRVVGDPQKIIKRVGIVGGSGAHDEDIAAALAMDLDCYITGEVKLPAAQKAYFHNLSLIEINHG
ncbi:MAG TPA: Nif3-like dinuclear metal center hexameric protein, partial [Bacilli bacterium]|nr:Nif3-like dinuclear metal center hexameric protein [Bacilli bacterium]